MWKLNTNLEDNKEREVFKIWRMTGLSLTLVSVVTFTLYAHILLCAILGSIAESPFTTAMSLLWMSSNDQNDIFLKKFVHLWTRKILIGPGKVSTDVWTLFSLCHHPSKSHFTKCSVLEISQSWCIYLLRDSVLFHECNSWTCQNLRVKCLFGLEEQICYRHIIFKNSGVIWTGLIWLRVGLSGGLLRTYSIKCWEILE
jgi:hypothetical protein